ncbi:hypothetical protein BH24ACT21_BH24ACT21_02610 [soil metagenome]
MVHAFEQAPRAGIMCLTLFVFLLVASACGTGSAPESAEAPETSAATVVSGAPETTAASEATRVTGSKTVPEITIVKEAVSNKRTQRKALVGCPEADLPPTTDTQSYARDYGLSQEVADRRMDLQMCLSDDLYALE